MTDDKGKPDLAHSLDGASKHRNSMTSKNQVPLKYQILLLSVCNQSHLPAVLIALLLQRSKNLKPLAT